MWMKELTVLTNKQRLLKEAQAVEPLFMYENPNTGKVNFGIVRLKICSIHDTLSLRPLYEKGLVVKTGETFEIELPSYGLNNVLCHVVKII